MHLGILTTVLLYSGILSSTTERQTDVNKGVMGDLELLSVWILHIYYGGLEGRSTFLPFIMAL